MVTVYIYKGCLWKLFVKEEFENNKGAIRIYKSEDKQYNDQKKKDKRTNNDLQNITQKTKHRVHLIIKKNVRGQLSDLRKPYICWQNLYIHQFGERVFRLLVARFSRLPIFYCPLVFSNVHYIYLSVCERVPFSSLFTVGL